jgi:hypothetical protein
LSGDDCNFADFGALPALPCLLLLDLHRTYSKTGDALADFDGLRNGTARYLSEKNFSTKNSSCGSSACAVAQLRRIVDILDQLLSIV